MRAPSGRLLTRAERNTGTLIDADREVRALESAYVLGNRRPPPVTFWCPEYHAAEVGEHALRVHPLSCPFH